MRMSATGWRMLGVLAGCAFFAAACSSNGGDSTPATATPTLVSPTPQGTPTSVATPAPTIAVATPTATGPRVASTVWLIDAEDAALRVVADNAGETIWSAAFGTEGDTVVVRYGSETAVYDFDGKAVTSGAPATCRDVSGGVDIGERVYAGARCGAISPNERWMYYEVETAPQQTYDAWLLDLDSGAATKVQEGLRHCGGCDGRYGPRWSASGRYVVFAELLQTGNVYLTDTETLKTSAIGSGSDTTQAPRWSPAADELLQPVDGQAAVLNATTGERRELQLAWPASWDTTGAYVYSPAWTTASLTDTTIMDAATGTALATLAGTPSWLATWTDAVHVVGRGSGSYTAALEGAAGCTGTMVWSTLRSDGVCVEGRGAAVSPDGTQVAVSRLVEQNAGPFAVPGSETPMTLARYEVVLVDVVSGGERTIDGDAYSYPATAGGPENPPSIRWNDQGSHVLALWPTRYGL